MEHGGDSPHYWSKPSTALLHQRRRQPPYPIVNPVVLILLIPISALLILFFIVSPFLSHTHNMLWPNSVKKSWDSLIILIVIFSIICGVFARRNDEVSETEEDSSRRKVFYSAPTDLREARVNRLRRSGSYPDLRQVSEGETGDDNRYRFFDDFEVIRQRSTEAEHDRSDGQRRRIGEERGADGFKVVHVDYVETRNPPPASLSPPAPPPPPPPLSAKLKRRRSLNNVERQGNVRAPESVGRRSSAPPPPPPPPPEVTTNLAGEDKPKLQRKKSATKEIGTAIASLYNQTKRKRRAKRRNNYEGASDDSPPSGSPLPPQTPPPPPPPPPPKGFQKLFKKSTNYKNNRAHSLSSSIAVPPPPPPFPPPPNSVFNSFFKSSKRFNQSPSTTPPPPPPPPTSIIDSQSKIGNKIRPVRSAKRTSVPPPPPPPPAHASSSRKTPSPPPYAPPHRRPSSSVDPPMSDSPTRDYDDENLNSGAQSPLIPMPPPPPPPPFRMREMKFVTRGDFVRIRSSNSSWCSSPEIDDCDVTVKSEQPDGAELIAPAVYCPSPDVNSKAESFIARLRDEWRLEKMNSIRENRKMG